MPFEDDETTLPVLAAQDFNWDDVNELSLGDGLERIAPDGQNAVRVAILPSEISKTKTAFVHFINEGDKKGFHICLSPRDRKGKILGKPAVCCTSLDDERQSAKQMFVCLALKYLNTQADGKFAKGTPPEKTQFEIGYLRLAASAIKSIAKITLEAESIWSMDFTISPRAKQIGYDYTRVAAPPRYTLDPLVKQEVHAAVEPYRDGVQLTKKLGKSLDDTAFRAIVKAIEVARDKPEAEIGGGE
jgi:hypothetical protein